MHTPITYSKQSRCPECGIVYLLESTDNPADFRCACCGTQLPDSPDDTETVHKLAITPPAEDDGYCD